MIEGFRIRNSQMFGSGLLAIFMVLTGMLLLFPANLEFRYSPVETNVISNIAVCGVLYTVWCALALALIIWSPGFKTLSRVIAVVSFPLVHMGYWVVATPNGFVGDFEAGGLAYVKLVQDTGRVILTPVWGYFEFPRTAIWGSMVDEITSLSPLPMRTMTLLLSSILLGVFLYLAYSRLLGDNRLAAIAVVLSVQGNDSIDGITRFIPGGQGLLFTTLFLFVFIILCYRQKIRIQDLLLSTLIIIGVAINHAISSVFLIAMLICTYVVLRGTKLSRTILSVLVIAFTIILTWQMYWSNGTFQELLTSFSATINLDLFFSIRAGQYLNPTVVPLWAVEVRMFWILVLFGASVMITIPKTVGHFLRVRRLGREEAIAIGGMLGAIVLGGLATLLSGGFQAYRFLNYGGFFGALIVVWFLGFNKYKRLTISFLVIAIVILSFPTFLAHDAQIGTGAVYPQEQTANLFLQSYSFPKVHLTTDVETSLLSKYYLPDAQVDKMPTPEDMGAASQFTNVMNAFRAQLGGADNGLLLFSPRFQLRYQVLWGISTDNPEWGPLNKTLSNMNIVYNNGFNQVYG